MAKRDFLSVDDVSAEELTALLDAADAMKRAPDDFRNVLDGKQVALVFEKPSTRTRVSFEVATSELGGHAVVLRAEELQLGRGETVEDTGRVLARYVDAIAVRTFGQERLTALAAASSVPVVNMLSEQEHPCQALADLQTLREHKGSLAGRVLAYIGDGNNVAHSLMLGGAALGMEVRVAAPGTYAPAAEVTQRAADIAGHSGGTIKITEKPMEAAENADVLYTDVWASMGREAESEVRKETFAHFQVDAAMVRAAARDVIVMHCLPAHRGEEIAAEVMDGAHSVVFDQAENRLHTQKALLAWLLTG